MNSARVHSKEKVLVSEESWHRGGPQHLLDPPRGTSSEVTERRGDACLPACSEPYCFIFIVGFVRGGLNHQTQQKVTLKASLYVGPA